VAAPIVQVAGTPRNVPNGCPGSASPATPENPVTCTFGGAYADRTYRLFPGQYPGGISLGKGTYLLEPGIYYLAGGGFRAAGGAAISVDAGTSTYGGGVLFYNTEAEAFHDACAAGTGTAAQCLAPIILNGGDADVNLMPLNDGSTWDGLVMFQDRNLSLVGDEVQINGGDSDMEVAGTIYVPSGDVRVNGDTGTLTLDQVIAWTFVINGNGGQIDVLYRTGVTAHVSGVGLVE
jgi:hypothetical protein